MAAAYSSLLPGATSTRRTGWLSRRQLALLIPLLLLGLLFTTRSRPDKTVEQQAEEAAVSIAINLLAVPAESPTAVSSVEEAPLETSTPQPAPTYLAFLPPRPCNRLTTTTTDGEDWLSPSPPLPADASLSSRLDAWLATPISTPGNWTSFNNQTCGNPSVRRSLNVVHERNSRQQWEDTSAEEVRELREGMVKVLRTAEKDGRFLPSREKSKRGIVFTAGNADTVSRVIVSLRLLRSYGTTLPAEVFHFASEKPANEHLDKLRQLNAEVRTVEGIDKGDTNGRTKSFHIKGSALVQSSFDELLYLDSDSLPTRNVDSLFESKGYRLMGAMFWSDYWKDSPENGIWRILGVQCRDEFTMESGQILIDKRRHLDVLLLVEHMLRSWPFFFLISDGDKDLLRYAFLALRKRWAVPGRGIASASWLSDMELGEKKQGEFCGHTMMQSDDRGEPMFVHANLLKRIAGNFYDGGTWGRTRRLSLPAPPSLSSSVFADASLDFTITADHLANANSHGLAILPAPPHVRRRAALERGLHTVFHDGHRGSAYVLCVETSWTDPRFEVEGDEAGAEEEELKEEEVQQCGPNSAASDVGYAEAGMEVVLWEEDALLKGFEGAFYKHGGKANGLGFR